MRLQRFFGIDDLGPKSLQERYGRNIYAVRVAVNRWLFEARPALIRGMPSRAARGYGS